MTLICDLGDAYCVTTKFPFKSEGTNICIECKQLINPQTNHYIIFEYNHDEEGCEIHIGKKQCCEKCGDLGESILEMGLCWTYGQLRDDIGEYNEENY